MSMTIIKREFNTVNYIFKRECNTVNTSVLFTRECNIFYDFYHNVSTTLLMPIYYYLNVSATLGMTILYNRECDIVNDYYLNVSAKIVSMIRKYHNHKPQTTQWHREEEPLNHHETPGKQNKQSDQQHRL